MTATNLPVEVSEERGSESGPVSPRPGANAASAASLLARNVLDEIEEALDPQIYPEQVRDNFDALPEREYSVTITAGLWSRIGRALNALEKAGYRCREII